MVRKKTVQHLDGRQKSLIDDALYSANPPEIKTFERIKRPPLLEYILLQLYRDLNKLNTEKVWLVLHVFTGGCGYRVVSGLTGFETAQEITLE